MSWLKDTLRTTFSKAAGSPPGQYFIQHAGKIGGVSFALGDFTLIGKNYFQNGATPNGAEILSGGIFLLADGLMALMDRHPSMKYPTGITVIAGAAALGYSGMGAEGQNQQLFGSAVICGQGLAFMYESQMQSFAKKMEQGSSKMLRAIFRPLAQYPILTTASVDIALSKIALAWAALLKGDAGLFAASALWIAGDLGVIGSDNNIKALLKKEPAPASLRAL